MAAPKKARKPVYGDAISKKMYETAKRDISRAEERLANDRAMAAQQALRKDGKKVNTDAIRSASIASGLFPRVKAVGASYGFTLPVHAKPSSKVSASTDFKSITIDYSQELVKLADSNEVDTSLAALRQVAGETRGLYYHELGHNRFTVPFKQLMNLAGDTTLNGTPTTVLHSPWNILEDQRMESAVVEESQHIATYLTVLVLRLIATEDRLGDNFPLLTGRWYLPHDVLQESARRYAETHGQDQMLAVKSCVARYMAATEAAPMVAEVHEMKRLLDGAYLEGFDNHIQITNQDKTSDPGEKMRAAATDVEDHEEDPSQDEDDTSGAAGDSDADEDADGEGNADGSGETEEGDGEEGGAEGNSDSDSDSAGSSDNETDAAGKGSKASTNDKVKDAIDKALDKWEDDKTLTEDVGAMNEAFNSGGNLPHWDKIEVSQDEISKAKANRLAIEMTEAFRTATADSAPMWVGQQRAGSLDVLRYATRQPGDMEVFRKYADRGDPGADLKVTVMLDVSMSMEGTGDALGGAGWAVKRAGDDLGIETEVFVFDTMAHVVYTVSDRPEFIPNIKVGGGTDIGALLRATLSEEADQANHLVLIMTDGEWSNKDALKGYKADNRTTVLFKYDTGWGFNHMDSEDRAQAVNGLLLNYGPDEAYMIDDLFDIPRILERLLVQIGGTR